MNPKASFGNIFRSELRGIKPSASRDNSTSASNFNSFVFSESHYNLPIPLRAYSDPMVPFRVFRLFAFGIGVSTINLEDIPTKLYILIFLIRLFRLQHGKNLIKNPEEDEGQHRDEQSAAQAFFKSFQVVGNDG